jgi:hypothetical protein
MSVLSRPLYRSRQFFTSLRPRIDEALRDEAYAYLSDGERRLFQSMLARDQQHSLEVYRRVRSEHSDRDLLAAALLHDCGKGRIALWHRVAFVLLDAAAPSFLRRVVAPGDGPGWRQALYRCAHHEELGAERARAAGASERTVQLIRGDRTDTSAQQLAALHAADDAS